MLCFVAPSVDDCAGAGALLPASMSPVLYDCKSPQAFVNMDIQTEVHVFNLSVRLCRHAKKCHALLCHHQLLMKLKMSGTTRLTLVSETRVQTGICVRCCQQVAKVDAFQLSQYELYSSRVKEFEVRGRQSHPRGQGSDYSKALNTSGWQLLGKYTAAKIRGTQVTQTPLLSTLLLCPGFEMGPYN